MHFYIHSLPPEAEIRIPASIGVPLLQVCLQLQLPPVITYSDDVLYNWALKEPSTEPTPALDNLRCLTLFTGTRDEEEFYLASARIELRGVDALEIMRATMDELFVGDSLAARRITRYLHSFVRVLDDLARLLLAVRDGCDPEIFYHVIRPWFNGADSGARKWTFEGIEGDNGDCAHRSHPHSGLRVPTELSGPSAAQSSLIHAIDAFLGVDHAGNPATHSPSTPHSEGPSPSPSSSSTSPAPEERASSTTVPARGPPAKAPFLSRMRAYMPRHHRNFLRHLGAAPRPLREAVARIEDAALTEAYNAAVDALRRFRDAHLRIVALYIIGPSNRSRAPPPAAPPRAEAAGTCAVQLSVAIGTGVGEAAAPSVPGLLRGTGGTDLVRFLKGVRDRTSETAFPSNCGAS